jgi:amino acid adenylation domain-containing protein
MAAEPGVARPDRAASDLPGVNADEQPQLSAAKRELLERRLRRGADGAAPGALSPVRRAPAGLAPLSVAQESIWYVTQLAPENPVYNESIIVRKRGEFNVDAFRAAFEEVVRRHEIWRSAYQLVEGEPRQVVDSPSHIAMPLLDVSQLPAEAAEREIVRAAADEARRPYDLERGPLIRPLLVRAGDGDHRLYLAMHHLVFDGVSLYQVVLPEMEVLYQAFAEGRPSPLVDPPAQYSDYAVWEQEWAGTSSFRRRLDYWQERLAGAPQLQLPSDHPRPILESFRGGMETVHINKVLVDQLESLSRDIAATLFQTIASAFGLLLHLYSGQADIVFGTVVDLRERPEFEGVLGDCLTPLVIRTDFSGDPTFMELVQRLRTDLVDAMDHRVPFQRLVQAVNPPRDIGANPIFQTMVMLEPPAAAVDSNWSVDPMDVDIGNAIGHAKWDFYLELDRREAGDIVGRLIFKTDLFERETARRMGMHWQRLLEGVASNPDRRISEIPVLSTAEVRQQTSGWNSTDRDFPHGACLHDLISAQAKLTPAATAVKATNESLSYAELEERSIRLANHLIGLGLSTGDRVGIHMERSVDLVVVLVAVLRAGGAYVPLEPDQPAERLTQMIADAQPAVILTTSSLRSQLPAERGVTVLVDADRDLWMGKEPSLAVRVDPTNLAYVLYTSGSTGRPKGVMISHRAIVNQLVWRVSEFALGSEDEVLQKTPFGFDVSLWELFCPLICGATVVMLDPGAHIDPARIAAAIQAERISALHFVPSMLRTFLDTVGRQGCESVRLVACSGERLTEELVAKFFNSFPLGVELINLYGPTEASVDATFWRCRPGEGTVPIGRPVANTQVYILDDRLHLVPIGASGEICIGGTGVASGYLNAPELTVERFVADPFRPGQSLYLTGDRGRLRHDGVIEYLGRNDDQVKIRGNRIEPGEVEAAIASHPLVRQAAVVGAEDLQGELGLIAYIVPQPDCGRPAAAELRSYLRERLPSAMIPSAFISIDAVPLTTSGKVNRRALPVPTVLERTREREYVAPYLPLHQQIATIWEELLGVPSVGIEDDFFALGGHSLLAVRMIRQLAQISGQQVPLEVLFERTSIAQLAELMLAPSPGLGRAAVASVQAKGTNTPLFFLHGDHQGGGFFSLDLGRKMGPNQPVHALHPHGIDEGPVPHSIEEMAAFYIPLIRGIQPTGPYQLAGYRPASYVALEIAQQLRAQGESVRILVMIDPGRPRPRIRIMRAAIATIGHLVGLGEESQVQIFLAMQTLYHRLRRMLHVDVRHRPKNTSQGRGARVFGEVVASVRSADSERGKGSALPRWRLAGDDADLTTWAEAEMHEEQFGRHAWAVAGYRPNRYPGRVMMFWSQDAAEVPRTAPRALKWWRRSLERVDTHSVPGDHATSVTRYSATLAAELKKCLDSE